MPDHKIPHRRPLALRDIASHSDSIAANSLDKAMRFLDAIEATVELLTQFPEAGAEVPTSRIEAQGLRAKLVSGFGNYIVLYFVSEQHIEIARVIRGGLVIDKIAFDLS